MSLEQYLPAMVLLLTHAVCKCRLDNHFMRSWGWVYKDWYDQIEKKVDMDCWLCMVYVQCYMVQAQAVSFI